MKLFILTLFAVVLNNAQAQDECTVYAQGLTDQGKQDVIDAHNRYRQELLDGNVDNQPQGKNINMLSYDEVLGEKAKLVSQQCAMQHVAIDDDRWAVGQNLYITWSSEQSTKQDWQGAVDSWWAEKDHYDYESNTSTDESKTVLHYTQVAWDKTVVIGCDFIAFYDNSQPEYPYAGLYTCNYGPAGNVNNERPYEKA